LLGEVRSKSGIGTGVQNRRLTVHESVPSKYELIRESRRRRSILVRDSQNEVERAIRILCGVDGNSARTDVKGGRNQLCHVAEVSTEIDIRGGDSHGDLRCPHSRCSSRTGDLTHDWLSGSRGAAGAGGGPGTGRVRVDGAREATGVTSASVGSWRTAVTCVVAAVRGSTRRTRSAGSGPSSIGTGAVVVHVSNVGAAADTATSRASGTSWAGQTRRCGIEHIERRHAC